MDPAFEQARAFFQQGLAHYQAQRYAQAEAAFAESLARVPGRPSTLTNLGAARLKRGRLAEALEPLAQACDQEPHNVEAWGHRAQALAGLGQLAPALDCADRALALDAGLGTAWGLRGQLLRDLGRPAEAVAAFSRAIELGAEVELNRYFLAGLQGEGAPPSPPAAYVEALFDGYADEFDAHLVGQLQYRVPQVLAQRLAAQGLRVARALDLGCGTGLCGPLLAPHAQALDGVDLSGPMLERARRLGVYETLAQADLVSHLDSTPRRYGLVVAADVFIYVGALDPVFRGVARVLEPGGTFCFSVEEAPAGCELVLQPSLRYAHSEDSVRALAAAHGFAVAQMSRGHVRQDQREPIPGLFFWLIRA